MCTFISFVIHIERFENSISHWQHVDKKNCDRKRCVNFAQNSLCIFWLVWRKMKKYHLLVLLVFPLFTPKIWISCTSFVHFVCNISISQLVSIRTILHWCHSNYKQIIMPFEQVRGSFYLRRIITFMVHQVNRNELNSKIYTVRIKWLSLPKLIVSFNVLCIIESFWRSMMKDRKHVCLHK